MTHNTGTRLPARHIYRRTKACLAKEFGACAGRNEDDILRATPHIWGLLSVRPMRTLLALILGFFSILSYAQRPSVLASATGLWQFEEHTVWVQIDQDGSAYQCRIAVGGTVYASTGTVVAPSSIHWQKIWGIDQVSLQADTMVLKGPHGAFRYQRATQTMAPACRVAR